MVMVSPGSGEKAGRQAASKFPHPSKLHKLYSKRVRPENQGFLPLPPDPHLLGRHSTLDRGKSRILGPDRPYPALQVGATHKPRRLGATPWLHL